MSITKIAPDGYVPHWQSDAEITVECEGCGVFYEDFPVIHWTHDYQIPPRALVALTEDGEAPDPPFFVCWFQCPNCATDELEAFGEDIWRGWGPWKEAGDGVCLGFDLALNGYGREA